MFCTRIPTSDVRNYPNYTFLQPQYIVANWGVPTDYYILRHYGGKARKVNHSQWFLWHVGFNCPECKIGCTQFMFGADIPRYLNLSVALHSCLTYITMCVYKILNKPTNLMCQDLANTVFCLQKPNFQNLRFVSLCIIVHFK